MTAVLVAGTATVCQPDVRGSFTYTPNAGFVGSDAFSYQASDGDAVSNTAAVTLVVPGMKRSARSQASTRRSQAAAAPHGLPGRGWFLWKWGGGIPGHRLERAPGCVRPMGLLRFLRAMADLATPIPAAGN